MYVCVCHAVTNQQISATIQQGATTFADLREELGVGSCCGKCSKDVRSQLRQECSGHCPCGRAGTA